MNWVVRSALCIFVSLKMLHLCFAAEEVSPPKADSVCLQCHSGYTSGEHVHQAIQLGCESCHKVEKSSGGTYVVLKGTESGCRDCHRLETPIHLHFPYAAGMCLRCHTPHSSTKPTLLRSNINEICLECHLQQPGRTPSASMPTIELTQGNTVGHPYLRHPVTEVPDPLQGGEMSCLSCHLGHGGTKPHLLKMGAQIPGDAINQTTETRDMCEACHLRLWGLPEGNARRKHNKQK